MISKLFKDSQRLDGRNMHEYRNISIRFPKSDSEVYVGGTCLVSFGDTSVFAKVTSSIVEPKSTHPSRGLFQLKIDTSLLKSNSKLRAPSEEALKLEPILKDILRDSIDLDSLCICAGERVFSIDVSVQAQTDDGNLLDVAMLAAAVSISTYRRPDVSVLAPECDTKDDRPPVSLHLNGLPATVTLGVAAEGGRAVADLSQTEEDVLLARIMLAVAPGNSLCCLYPLGASVWTYDQFIDSAIELAVARAEGLQALLAEAVRAANSEAGRQTIVVESRAFMGCHPCLETAAQVAEEEEEERAMGEAPEAEEGEEEDMEVDSDEQGDDWAAAGQALVNNT